MLPDNNVPRTTSLLTMNTIAMQLQIVPPTPNLDDFATFTERHHQPHHWSSLPSSPVSASMPGHTRSSSTTSSQPICCGWHQKELAEPSSATSEHTPVRGGRIGFDIRAPTHEELRSRRMVKSNDIVSTDRQGMRFRAQLKQSLGKKSAPRTWSESREEWAKKRPKWEDGRSVWEDFAGVQPGGLIPPPRIQSNSTDRIRVAPIPLPPVRARIVRINGRAVLQKPVPPLDASDDNETEEAGEESEDDMIESPAAIICSLEMTTETQYSPGLQAIKRSSSDLDVDSNFGLPTVTSAWSFDSDESSPHSDASGVDSLINGYCVPDVM